MGAFRGSATRSPRIYAWGAITSKDHHSDGAGGAGDAEVLLTSGCVILPRSCGGMRA